MAAWFGGTLSVVAPVPTTTWAAPLITVTTVGYGDIVPMTVAGRIVGGGVSIIGIGTLALFSGLITVGFLDQLKTYREQHARSVVAEPVIVVSSSAPDCAPPAWPVTCPHCGSAFSYPTHRDERGEGSFAA